MFFELWCWMRAVNGFLARRHRRGPEELWHGNPRRPAMTHSTGMSYHHQLHWDELPSPTPRGRAVLPHNTAERHQAIAEGQRHREQFICDFSIFCKQSIHSPSSAIKEARPSTQPHPIYLTAEPPHWHRCWKQIWHCTGCQNIRSCLHQLSATFFKASHYTAGLHADDKPLGELVNVTQHISEVELGCDLLVARLRSAEGASNFDCSPPANHRHCISQANYGKPVTLAPPCTSVLDLPEMRELLVCI